MLRLIVVVVCLFFSGVTARADVMRYLTTFPVGTPYMTGYFEHAIDSGPLNTDLLEEEGSLFNRLKNYFDEGMVPQREDMLGWTSGRCYSKLDPDVPEPALMVGELRYSDAGYDHGPLFEPEEEFKVLFISHVLGEVVGAGYFDFLDEAQVSDVVQRIDQVFPHTELAYEGDNSLVTETEDLGKKFQVRIRKWEDYFFVQASLAEDTEIGGETITAGTPFAYCYYFNRLGEE